MFIKRPITDEVRDAFRINLSAMPLKAGPEPVCDLCADETPVWQYLAVQMSTGEQRNCWRWAVCTNCSVALDAEDWQYIRSQFVQQQRASPERRCTVAPEQAMSFALQQLMTYLARVPEEQAALILWGDQQAASGDKAEATRAFKKVLTLNPDVDVAEMVKDRLRHLAERGFRAATGGHLRMDAVRYCLDALKRLSDLPPDKVKQVGAEIAVIGLNGLDINNPDSEYRIESLGTTLNGLRALCYEFVALRQTAPELDIGFDLTKEFEAAISMKSRGFMGLVEGRK